MEWLKVPIGEWLELTKAKQKQLDPDEYEVWLSGVKSGKIKVRRVPILTRTKPA